MVSPLIFRFFSIQICVCHLKPSTADNPKQIFLYVFLDSKTRTITGRLYDGHLINKNYSYYKRIQSINDKIYSNPLLKKMHATLVQLFIIIVGLFFMQFEKMYLKYVTIYIKKFQVTKIQCMYLMIHIVFCIQHLCVSSCMSLLKY